MAIFPQTLGHMCGVGGKMIFFRGWDDILRDEEGRI